MDNSYSFCITLLNDWTLPFITTPFIPHTGPYAIPGAPLFPCTLDLLLLPSLAPCYHLTYSSVFASSVEPDLDLDSPVIPRSAKAIAREAQIHLIRGFLNTHLRPADISDAEFQSFINSATKFFVLHDSLWCHKLHGHHQLVVPEHQRYGLIKEAHDDLGHKGVFTVRTHLLLRFWWPMLVNDMKWFVRTCHKCQIWQTRRLHIPPTIPVIGSLFRKAHLDTMVMPRFAGYQYIVQACCALTAYPEWQMLRSENAAALTSFIFEDILCRWGPLAEIVTDNGPDFIQAVDVLADRYKIRHIHISPYNSQANGVVEWHHFNVREAIVKSSLGGESHWHTAAHLVFWAERVTVLRSTGLSPYFMVHGVEPLLPFDLVEATFLVPPPDTEPLSPAGLIAWRARQLQKHQEDLELIRERIFKARFESVKHFEATFKNRIKDFDFRPGSLVLVHNTRIEKELNQETKPQYLGPVVVLRRTTRGFYLLAELDGAVSRLRYAAF